MSLTPERRITPPGSHGLSVHSLVNNTPLLDRYMEIPSVRVDPAERSQSSLSQVSHASGKGNVLDSVYSPIATMLVKAGVGLMIFLSLLVLVVGDNLILHLSQLFGFIAVFVLAFTVSCGGYLWWMSWVHEAIKLDIHSTLMMLLACAISEVVSTVANHLLDFGQFESLPIDLSFYAVHTTSLFFLFASLVHQRGSAAMFSHETCIFVCLTVVMHYTSASIFSKLLPSFLYCQIVYGSCLLAMCISLILLKHQPSISLVALRRIIRTSIHSKRDVMPASYSGRRFSNASLMSSMSSIRPKTSVSSFSGYQDMIDTDALNEANGILGDLLFQEDRLTQKGKESLKHIQQLLSFKFPTSTVQYLPRSRLSSGESDVTTGGNLISGYRKQSVTRRKNQSSEFTTTTTSTGLPNVERDPQERKRSRASIARMSMVEGRRSVHRMLGRERLPSQPSPLSKQYKVSMPNLSRPARSSDYTDGSSDAFQSSAPTSESSAPHSEEEEEEGRVFVRQNTNRSDSLDVIRESEEDAKLSNSSLPSVPSETETEIHTPSAKSFPHSFSSSGSLAKFPLTFGEYKIPEQAPLEQYRNHNIELLERVVEWDFPIFELEEVTDGTILSQMAFCLFKDAGLMETFSIPPQEFINYFRALEANYGANTYHNKTHAADVLHATSYLLFEQIPEFSCDIDDSLEPNRRWAEHTRLKVSGGNIASAFSILEVFACYMAAAMHDFDHPGRTNAFLVATHNPLAFLYNDRSVLENHHAAASWDLLVSNPKNNFLTNLDSSELKRFRFLIIECILATDLKQHFDIVREFKEQFDPLEGAGIDWTSDVDRLKVMKMVIKMADINTPTKSHDLHRSWTVRITEEFYQQHDDEIRLGLPQTIFMHRDEKEKLPAIQVSFIQNLVAPLFRACAEVGIIPGVVESMHSTGSKEEKEEEGLTDIEISSDDVMEDDDDEDSIPDEAALIRPTKKIFSIILTNLQTNFESWKDELPKEKTEPEEDNLSEGENEVVGELEDED